MKRIAAIIIAATLCTSAFTSFAGTGTVVTNTVQSETLKDNILEFGEIDELVSTYNPTVIKNRLDLKDFKKKYGTTKDEIAEKYRQMAEDIRSQAQAAGAGAASMAFITGSTAEMSALSMEMQADNVVEDAEMMGYNFDLAEKTIALTAKTNMIAYYSALLDEEKANLQQSLLESAYEVAKLQNSLGMNTKVDLLTAQSNYYNGLSQVTLAKAATKKLLNSLIVSCGWNYGDNAVIAELPPVDFNKITAYNPVTDYQKALTTNYTLKVNEKKLTTAESSSAYLTNEAAVGANKQNIAVSINTAYNSVINAKNAYDTAVHAADLQRGLLTKADNDYKQGQISSIEYNTQQVAARTAEIARLQALYALQTAMVNYEYMVDGLAGA